jgi:hypothetical protein
VASQFEIEEGKEIEQVLIHIGKGDDGDGGWRVINPRQKSFLDSLAQLRYTLKSYKGGNHQEYGEFGRLSTEWPCGDYWQGRSL